MIGRVLETKKMKTFIFIKVGNANEVACGQIDKSLEPRPHTSDIVKFDIENDPNEILPHFVNMDVLERCNAPEIVNPDMIQISLYKSKFEQIADEHFSKIGAVKVRTPTLGRYKGTSNIDPYETQNKKGKTLYLKFTHDLLLRSVLADLMVPVYEIGNVFRNMGISYKYATEYTMLESHIPCQDLQYGIHFAQTILQDFAHSIGKNDFDNLPVKTLQQSFSEFGKDLTSMSDSEQVDFYKDKIKPSGTFVSVYQPAIASPLAKIDPETNLGLDAEVVYNGKGIAHIYVCENNYDKLVKIFKNQDKTQQRWDKDFLLKAKAGIPSTVGVAIGLDRTIAGLCGVTVNDLVMRGKLSNER